MGGNVGTYDWESIMVTFLIDTRTDSLSSRALDRMLPSSCLQVFLMTSLGKDVQNIWIGAAIRGMLQLGVPRRGGSRSRAQSRSLLTSFVEKNAILSGSAQQFARVIFEDPTRP